MGFVVSSCRSEGAWVNFIDPEELLIFEILPLPWEYVVEFFAHILV